MTFSGTAGPSTINLQQPNTHTGEENFAGNGTLGPFAFRNISAETSSPQPSSACSGPTRLYFLRGGRRRRISLPGRKSLDGHGHGGDPLHRFRPFCGPPYRDLSDHRRNRTIRGRTRQPYVDGDVEGSAGRRLWRAQTLDEYGRVRGDTYGSAIREERQHQRQ